MSFVYAFQDEEGITVISDTKIGIDQNVKGWESQQMKLNIEAFGIIKCMILNPHLLLAFAGNNIKYVDDLMAKLKEKPFTIDEMIQWAYNIHLRTKKDNDIEFIICYFDENEQKIVSIKDKKEPEILPFAWIGSVDTFKEYRRLMMEDESSSSYKRVNCIINAIQSGVDDSVGGVIVTVNANKNRPVFCYWEKFVSCPINQCIKPNENLILSDGPEKGYYTYQVYQSEQNVALYFLEGEFGVIYSSIGEEKELNMEHLYLPHKVKVPQIYFDAYAWQIEADRGIYLESYTREDRLRLLSKERDCYSVSDKHFFIYDKWIKHLIGDRAKK